MPPFAFFGIESSGLKLAVDLVLLFLVVLYLVADLLDVRRRAAPDLDPMLIGCATVASLFPFVGTIVYIILSAARVPRGRARARTRDAGREARLHSSTGRCAPTATTHGARLHSLSELPAQAQGALRQLLAPARPGLDDMPLLRGRCPGAHRAEETQTTHGAGARERGAGARELRGARTRRRRGERVIARRAGRPRPRPAGRARRPRPSS